MTNKKITKDEKILVAMDIAKSKHVILIQWPDGKRRKQIIQSNKQQVDEWILFLKSLEFPCLVGFEPTGDYHRTIVYWLQQAGIEVTSVLA